MNILEKLNIKKQTLLIKKEDNNSKFNIDKVPKYLQILLIILILIYITIKGSLMSYKYMEQEKDNQKLLNQAEKRKIEAKRYERMTQKKEVIKNKEKSILKKEFIFNAANSSGFIIKDVVLEDKIITKDKKKVLLSGYIKFSAKNKDAVKRMIALIYLSDKLDKIIGIKIDKEAEKERREQADKAFIKKIQQKETTQESSKGNPKDIFLGIEGIVECVFKLDN